MSAQNKAEIRFSLEVFPPKTEAGVDQLLHTVDAYSALKPSYITVTSGAGGSAEDTLNSRNLVRHIVSQLKLPVAAHLTCAGKSRTVLDATIDDFWQDGVRHIVTLRGDILGQNGPYMPHPEGYFYTADLVTSIKQRYPEMFVSVAGYPEIHPESPSQQFDLDHLKRKVDAGADQVLTQFFFDPEIFLHWRDKLAAHRIHVPVVPGLLPILNFPKLLNFARKCNASVPGFLYTMFDTSDPESIDHKLLAMNVLSHQITRLIEHEVRDFHFYTLNDTLLTKHLCTWMRAGF